MTENIELLAPAGGMRELVAAVNSGADAVYIGADMFSARAGAGNFTQEQMQEAVKYAHAFGVKVHCAINTLIKESEFQSATETAISAAMCGVDAIIVQDLGLASHLREILPDMELHASTQMTVTSAEGVKYLKSKGFNRVVLARELSMSEIEKIVKSTNIEIEVFVHGAICMSYSGQCLMSSILGGRSGNRGRCAQPCRLCYSLLENGRECKTAYALSPKDMALINHLDELKRIGVASLKIEGRLKSAEYVSAVVGVYRKYLDSGAPIAAEDIEELKNAFSRSGFTDGYFTGKLGKALMSHDNPANNSGSTFTKEAKDRIAGKGGRKIPINIFASLKEGEPLKISVYDNDGNVINEESAAVSEKAISHPMDKERLISQLSKLGDTAFSIQEIYVDIDEGITVPIKEINNTRRIACEKLWNERAKVREQRIVEVKVYDCEAKENSPVYLTAEVMTIEQGRAVIKTGKVRRIYAPSSVAEVLMGECEGTEIITKTSDILTDEKLPLNSVSVSSPGAMYRYSAFAQYGDFRLNIYNSYTAKEFRNLDCITLSPELNLTEIKQTAQEVTGVETEIIGYGHIPLMLMRNCPVKALGKCQNGKRIYTLRDRKNVEFPILCSDDCRAVLLNSKPIFVADIMDEVLSARINCIRLNFTVENPAQCDKIVNMYASALSGNKVEPPEVNTFTRGHFRRGVQ